MTLLADFGVDEETVEEAEAFGARVMIRRDGAREKEQRRVAVALRQIGEQLIVGAVLFDDVDDMFERWILRARARAIPTVGARHTLRELAQLNAAHAGQQQ